MEELVLIDFGLLMGLIVTLAMGAAAIFIGETLGLALADAAENIPLWGGAIADGLRGAVHWIQNKIAELANAAYTNAVQPITDLANGVANNSRANQYSLRETEAQIIGQLNYLSAIVSQSVPQPVVTHTQETAGAIDSRVNAMVSAAFSSAVNYAEQVYTTATTWANTAIQSVYSDVVDADSRIATAEQSLQQEIQTEHTNLVDFIQQSRDYAVQTAEQWANDIADTINNNIAFVDEQLNGRITSERDETNVQVQNLGDAINMNRDAITTFIQTQVLPRVADIEKFDEECAKPTCDNLLGFARLFGIGKNLLSDALLIEWLASLYAGGEGYNQQVVNDVKGFYGGPRDIIQQIIGR